MAKEVCCPKCKSVDLDIAPKGSKGDLECQECGKIFKLRKGQ